MLSLSRRTEKGVSYRTVQRFFKEKIDWTTLHWPLIKQHTQEIKGVWLLVHQIVNNKCELIYYPVLLQFGVLISLQLKIIPLHKHD